MESNGSVTRWIRNLRDGDREAANRLWSRFARRMKMLAKDRARPAVTSGVYDEEDVALSAFASFCRALCGGNYPDLTGRDELWQLLATFTFRKARERAVAARALKRGGLEGDAANTRGRAAREPRDLDAVESESLGPDSIAMMNEQCAHLFGLLKDEDLEIVALRKLEGYTNEEIALEHGCTKRTVQRMLALIRRIWQAALE